MAVVRGAGAIGTGVAVVVVVLLLLVLVPLLAGGIAMQPSLRDFECIEPKLWSPTFVSVAARFGVALSKLSNNKGYLVRR